MAKRPLSVDGVKRVDADVLNPRLYGLLVNRFHRVEIGSQGMAAITGQSRRGPDGRQHTRYVAAGEYYKLCCPYCDDTKFRLWVNHLWCEPDPLTGDPMRHLAICYHGDCFKRSGTGESNYIDFHERVFGFESSRTRVAREARERAQGVGLRPGRIAQPVAIQLPGECVPLAALPEEHAAVRYVRSRGFDPKELTEQRDVQYCARVTDDALTLALWRLILPVKDEKGLVGWQARTLTNAKPKYWTMPGFKAGSHLYGYDVASVRSPQLVVVTEGPTDVWAVGDAGVACFGKKISYGQRQLLAKWAGRGGACLLCFDPGAWTTEVLAEHQKRAEERHQVLLYELRDEFKGRFAEIKLPDGRDPGGMVGQLRPYLYAKALEAGLDISQYGAANWKS